MNKLGLGLGASALGAVTFATALHVHFPGEAVVQRVRWEIQENTKGEWAFEAEDAGWWMPGGITFENARMLRVDVPTGRRRGGADAEAAPAAKEFFRADSLSARLALLPLLTGTKVVEYAAEVWGGSLEGQFGESETHRLITIHTDGLDLTRIPLSGDEWSIDARGTLKLDADLQIALAKGKDAPPNSGTILLEIENFVIDNSTMMGMDLVSAEFREAVLELQMDGKKADIKRGHFESDLIDLTVGGNLNIATGDPDRWRIRVELSFTLGDTLDAMAGMLPNLKRARGEDGTYHMLCTGTWGNPVCREDRSKVRGGPTAADRPPRPDRGDLGPGDGEDRRRKRTEDAEKRREERKKRLQDRRSRMRDERPPQAPPEDRFDDAPDIELDNPMGMPKRPRQLPGDDFDRNYVPEDGPQFDDEEPPVEFDGPDVPGVDEMRDLGYEE